MKIKTKHPKTVGCREHNTGGKFTAVKICVEKKDFKQQPNFLPPGTRKRRTETKVSRSQGPNKDQSKNK